MARLWMTGFEVNGTVDEWFVAGNAPSVQTSTIRSGVRALEITSLSSGNQKSAVTYFNGRVNGNGPFFARFYFRVHTAPSAANRIFKFENNSLTSILSVKLTNTRTLQLFNGTTQIGSDTSALTADTWYRIEVKFDNTGGASAGIGELLIDGNVAVTSSSQTFSTGVHRLYVGGNLASEAQTTGDWFFDDCALNDSTGSAQTTYPGSGKIIAVFPNAAGDNAGMTRGGTDTGANWNQCSENPPDDITTYVSSATVNTTDEYKCTASTSELGASDTINVIGVNVRNSGASSSSVAAAKPHIKSAASGTVLEGTAITPITTIWQTNAAYDSGPMTQDMFTGNLFSYTDPSGGGAWTKALVDTMQIGAKITTGNTNAFRMTAVWANIDFTPAAAPAATPKTLAALGCG